MSGVRLVKADERTGAIYMLKGKDERPVGRWPLAGSRHTVVIAEDFAGAGPEFTPPKNLHKRAVRWGGRVRKGLRFGRWSLGGDMLLVVRSAHRGAKFAMGRKLFTSVEGVRCPSGYAFVGDKLVAMIAPRLGDT